MFRYLIKKPKIIEKANPAILMLHGYGSNEMDLFSLAEHFPENYYIFSVRAPYSLDFAGYAWYDIFIDENGIKQSNDVQALESVHLVSKFIDKLIIEYQLNTKNFNLLGFSQGSILSYALALHYPEKIKNIVALSGYINENIMPLKYNNNYGHINIFASHGIYDDIIPVELARKIPDFLSKLNIKHTYKEFPMGHEVSLECLEDMLQWVADNSNI